MVITTPGGCNCTSASVTSGMQQRPLDIIHTTTTIHSFQFVFYFHAGDMLIIK